MDDLQKEHGFDFLSEVEAGCFRRYRIGNEFGVCTTDGKTVKFPVGKEMKPYDKIRCGWPTVSCSCGINFIFPLEDAQILAKGLP